MHVADTAAIVTGGASGLGAATANELASRGCQVFALDLAASVEQAPTIDGITYVECDVTSPDSVAAAVKTGTAIARTRNVARLTDAARFPRNADSCAGNRHAGQAYAWKGTCEVTPA